MKNCFVCKKPLCKGKTITVKDVKPPQDKSKVQSQNDEELLVAEVIIHSACHKKYTNSRKNEARNQNNGSCSPVFDFGSKCFVCAEDIIKDDSPKTSKRKKVSAVCKQTMRTNVINLLCNRKEEALVQIRERVESVSDLIAVGAKYHRDCVGRLYVETKRKEHGGRTTSIEQAMEHVYTYMHEKLDERQYLLSELINSIKGNYIPDKRTVKKRLLQKFGDDVLISDEPSGKTIVLLKASYQGTKLDPTEESSPKRTKCE